MSNRELGLDDSSSRRRLPWALSGRRLLGAGALAAVCLAAGAGSFYQATPQIRAVDPDPAAPLVQAFSIRNPSAFITLRDVRWSCVLERIGTSGRLTIPGVQKQIEIAPLSSRNARCTTMSILSSEVMAVHITVRFHSLFLERVVSAAPLYWQTSGGRGRWLDAKAISTLPPQVGDRPTSGKP